MSVCENVSLCFFLVKYADKNLVNMQFICDRRQLKQHLDLVWVCWQSYYCLDSDNQMEITGHICLVHVR